MAGAPAIETKLSKLKAHLDRGGPQWPEEKQGAIADALERMADGLIECNDPECDWCHPEES